MRTEYQPPVDVLAAIHAFLEDNPDFFGKKKIRAAPPAPPHQPRHHVSDSGVAPYHPQAPVALDINRLRLALTLTKDAARAATQPMTIEQEADLVMTFYMRLDKKDQ